MKALRIKRGWVYRGVFICVALLAALMFFAFIFSILWKVESRWPLDIDSLLMIDIWYGSIDITYIETHYPGVLIDVRGPEIPALKFLRLLVFYVNLNPPFRGWAVTFPMWLPFLVFIAWPFIVFVSKLSNGHTSGCCVACGYDLRGSAGSATCPECGEAIKQQVAS